MRFAPGQGNLPVRRRQAETHLAGLVMDLSRKGAAETRRAVYFAGAARRIERTVGGCVADRCGRPFAWLCLEGKYMASCPPCRGPSVYSFVPKPAFAGLTFLGGSPNQFRPIPPGKKRKRHLVKTSRAKPGKKRKRQLGKTSRAKPGSVGGIAAHPQGHTILRGENALCAGPPDRT